LTGGRQGDQKIRIFWAKLFEEFWIIADAPLIFERWVATQQLCCK